MTLPPAAEPIIYGSPVQVIDGKVYPAALVTMQGIARRPIMSDHDRHYLPGEEVRIKTDGDIMMELDAVPSWVILKDGRILG